MAYTTPCSTPLDWDSCFKLDCHPLQDSQTFSSVMQNLCQLDPGSGAAPPIPSLDSLGSQEYWRRCREAVAPLAAAPAEVGGGAAEAAQLAVDVAEALATRPCANPGCATIVGPSEAAAPRGKRCSGCRLVRYCGQACQLADWGAHKAACRELARRQRATLVA